MACHSRHPNAVSPPGTFLNLRRDLNAVGSERVLYLLAFILLFSTVFTADGPACGSAGCDPQITSPPASLSPDAPGVSITSTADGFTTLSTANGSSMKIEKGALDKLRAGERVRLFVRKRKSQEETAPLPQPENATLPPEANITAEPPADNSTNITTAPENITLPSDNSTDTTLNETTNSTLPSENSTNESLNATLPEITFNESLNAALNESPNITANETLGIAANETETAISTPPENSANDSLSFTIQENLSTNESSNFSLNITPADNTSNFTLPENQSLRQKDRGIVGEFILFYQKFLLMIAPPPDNSPLPSEAPLQPAAIPSAQVDVITDLASGDQVVETGIGGLAALANSGAEEVYIDYNVTASLTDTVPLIGASAAQSNLSITGSGITVCLLDTGVDFTEPTLNGTAISGYDFVNNDADATDDSLNMHGTKMAAVIHAVAPDATIIAVKVLDENGTGYASNVIAGIDYCMQAGSTVKIISMSLGGGSYTGYCDSDPVADEANFAASQGLFVTAATGNDGSAGIDAPACGSNVTAVASTTKQDAVSPFSNMNGMVDLLAPGQSVIILGSSNSGTSVSAAHVSGAAALLLQSNTSLSPADAEWRLKSTGVPIEYQGANYSRINVYDAILDILGGMPTNQSINNTNETQNVTYGAQTSAGNVTCGQNLDTAGALYTMNASSSISGQNCFNVTAANITIDCQGFSIAGNNSSSTYGVISNQYNTTIRNCNISNFSVGIFFNTASDGLIRNTTASTTYPFAWSNDGSGFYLLNAVRNSVINSTGISPSSGTGIYIYRGGYTNITNSTGSSASNSGIVLRGSYNVTISNTQITGKENTSGALRLSGTGTNNNNLIANNTINGLAGTYAITLMTGAVNVNNSFINNTILNATNLLYLDAGASSNTFCLNNFTSIGSPTTYVQDLNGTNSYNCTYGGIAQTQGNIYANVLNGSIGVYGTNNSSIAGLYIGTSGAGVPYSNTTSGSKFSCNFVGCADYAPLTNQSALQCGVLSSASTIYTMTANASINGSTCFTVTAANVTLDCAGFSVTGNNSTATYGIYSNQFNTTIKNCNISNFNYGIYYQNSANGTINGNNVSASSGNAVLVKTSNYTIVANNIINNSNGAALQLTASLDTIIANNTAISPLNAAIGVTTASNRASLSNNTILASFYGLYLDGGSNVSMDCLAASVTGTNASSTFGIYSNQFNTTIKNCNISNFETAINFNGATNGTIDSTNASSTRGGGSGIYLSSSSYNTITNFIGTTTSGYGINSPNSNNNIIINSTLSANTGYGVYLSGTSNNNQFIGTVSGSASSSAFYIAGGSNVSIDCQGKSIVGTNTSGTYGIYSSQFNTTVKNCNISNFATGIYFGGATDGLIQNNTILTSKAGGTEISMTSTAHRNSIIQNTLVSISTCCVA